MSVVIQEYSDGFWILEDDPGEDSPVIGGPHATREDAEDELEDLEAACTALCQEYMLEELERLNAEAGREELRERIRNGDYLSGNYFKRRDV